MENTAVFARQELDTYFASYVGMEGGNPRGSVWFCDRSSNPWSEHLKAPLEPRMAPLSWDRAFREAHRGSMGKWLSHQRIARIMAAARAEVLGLRDADADWKSYYEHCLYSSCGAEFKLNLFPVPVQLDGLTPWSRVFRGQPELVPKERYLDLCRYGGRFRFLAEMCARWRPKVVVCLGHRHTEDFVSAFALDGAAVQERQLQPADLVKSLRVFTRDDSTWIICPALAGPSGLTSDVLLSAFGKVLAAMLDPADFAPASEARQAADVRPWPQPEAHLGPPG